MQQEIRTKTLDPNFDIAMGAYDSAEACELVEEVLPVMGTEKQYGLVQRQWNSGNTKYKPQADGYYEEGNI